MDAQEYLEPDFDPNSLTVPKLRSILVAHNVNYPSSAKKAELVQYFNAQVLPQARKLRAASLRVKRTSRGIVDVPTSQTADDENEDDEQLMPPPPSTGRRKATRARTEEAQEVAQTPRSTRHSTAPPDSAARKASSKHARTTDEAVPESEPEPKRPASRKSRLSAQTPVVKREADEDASPFSAENVFQSGSSPPPPATDRRRTTTTDIERRRSRELRRRTDQVKPARPQMDGAVVPSRKAFQPALKKEEIETSEEFTPEGQQELVQAQASGELVPARPRKHTSTTTRAGYGVSAVLTAILLALAALWGQEKFHVGYCDEGRHSKAIAGWEIPEWADVARPVCEPCPPHAHCYSNFKTECGPGFVLTQHPLSLGGLLPFPPTCEPDSVMAKKVDQVKQRAVERLREENADFLCGKADSPHVKESELKATISSMRRSKMSDEEFEKLWDSAIGEVRSADEVSIGTEGSGHFTLRSNSLARIPLSCAIRRSLRETAREYFWQLVGVVLLTGSAAYGNYAITSGRETTAQVNQLAGIALKKLSEQAALHAADPDVYTENYMSMAQLRDDVLRNDFSTMNRRKLWEKVQQKVEKNANVRPMVREGRSGDVGRVWEWVGAIGRIESPAGGSSGGHNRRKSGRVTFGGEQWIEPASEDSGAQEMSQVGRWKEGGQYY